MTRATWRTIIASRYFYIQTYRRLLYVLILSILLNLMLGFLIIYVYLNRAAPTYYASNGMTGPMILKPLQAPNNSSTPLLESEPQSSGAVKQVPG